ncbi:MULTISPECIES: cytochrome C oxidase subunit III [unclassified Bacillus (in: firmicutes)]|uniref:Cytochrome C oxidase subunit III n=2 Tax=Bacillus bruguierae TaxID=3127667 RepID=A0ABU8FFF8_9BACI|nr:MULTISPECIES: cytochrome C oxidase subunit III [unclassified Bacillus (in: firmicutes)]SFI89463.1 PAX-interacting protein 1 [Bacillus sp. 71mf]SFS66749.1 PAX-interacting protein 1 [Bacillus sp. 103mf]
MANYQQPDPYNNLEYWYQLQQQMQKKQQEQQQEQQQIQQQLEQQGYVKKKGCNCGGKKK